MAQTVKGGYNPRQDMIAEIFEAEKKTTGNKIKYILAQI